MPISSSGGGVKAQAEKPKWAACSLLAAESRLEETASKGRRSLLQNMKSNFFLHFFKQSTGIELSSRDRHWELLWDNTQRAISFC